MNEPNESYELVILNESNTYSTTGVIQPIPEWITLMNQFFLVNQSHTKNLYSSINSRLNYSYDPVLFIEPNTDAH